METAKHILIFIKLLKPTVFEFTQRPPINVLCFFWEIKFNNLIEIGTIISLPTETAIDSKFFVLDDEFFGVVLTNKTTVKIFKQSQDSFMEYRKLNIFNVTSINIFHWQNTVYLLARIDNHVIVYNMDVKSENLIYIQTISSELLNKISIGNSERNQIFLGLHTNTNTLIYKWSCSVFDLVQEFNSKSENLKFFDVSSSSFLAIFGKGCVIFKFDINEDKFEWYQKLTTELVTSLAAREINNQIYLLMALDKELLMFINNNEGIFYKFLRFDRQPHFMFMDYLLGNEFISVSQKQLDIFTYNDWNFTKKTINKPKGNYSLESFLNNYWLVSTENNTINIEKIIFKEEVVRIDENDDKEEVLDWCQQKLDATEKSEKDLLNLVSIGQTELQIENLTVEELETEEFGLLNKQLVESLNNLALRLDELEALLLDTDTLVSSMVYNDKIIDGPISLSKLIVNCSNTAHRMCQGSKSIKIENLNGEKFSNLLSELIVTESAIPWYSIQPLNFENITIRHIQPRLINTKIALDLVSCTDDAYFPGSIVINGTITFHDDVYVNNKINGVKMNKETVVLINEDQNLNGDLILLSASIQNLTLNGLINGIDFNSGLGFENPYKLKENWDHLDIDNLIITTGMISEFPYPNISQSIKNYYNIEVDKIDSKMISNVNLSDLIQIDNPNDSFNFFNLSLMFNESVYVNNLTVSNTINNEQFSSIPSIISGQEDFNLIEKSSINLQDSTNNIYAGKREIIGPVTIIQLQAKTVNFTGLLNNKNFTNIIDDLVAKNYSGVINGPKHMQDLSQSNIKVKAKEIFLRGDQIFNYTLSAFDVFCRDSLLNTQLKKVIESNEPFEGDVVFANGVSIENLFINGLNVTKILKNPIKINEDTTLKTVNMIENISAPGLQTTNGLVNGANFEKSLLRRFSSEQQFIEGDFLVTNELNIKGKLTIKGGFHGLNVTEVCQLDSDGSAKPTVEVHGTVRLIDEPKIIGTVNKLNLTEFKNSVWLSDKPVQLNKANFDNLQIFGKPILGGYLNNVNLTLLKQRYLSKTSSSIIRTNLTVNELVITENALFDEIEGDINGINIKNFSKSVLLNNTEQHFESIPTFKEIRCPEIHNTATINNINFNYSILLYDKPTEMKNITVKSATVQRLVILDKNITIQDVNIFNWRSKALSQTSGGVIEGDVIFNKIRFRKPLWVFGNVQNVTFTSEDIVTTLDSYNITGSKTFVNSLNIENLQKPCVISGIDLGGLLDNMKYSDENLNIPWKFQIKNLKVSNMSNVTVFGVNTSEICDFIENQNNVNYYGEKYKSLLSTAMSVYSHMNGSAYFVDHYRLIQKIKYNASGLILLKINGEQNLILFSSQDNKNEIYLWQTSKSKFISKGTYTGLSGQFKFVNQVMPDFTFLEHDSGKSLILLKHSKIDVNLKNTTCIAYLGNHNDSDCFYHGSYETDTTFCLNNSSINIMNNFDSLHCIQSVGIMIEERFFVAVISNGSYWNKPDTKLTIFEFEGTLVRRQVLAVINPVSVAAIYYGNEGFLAVSSLHPPGSVRSSLVSIFRYRQQTNTYIRFQDISIDAPGQIAFSILPSQQLVLYLLSGNPSKPFVVYLYHGSEGFVLETIGLTLHSGSFLRPIPIGNDHLLAIVTSGFVQILQAEMNGLVN